MASPEKKKVEAPVVEQTFAAARMGSVAFREILPVRLVIPESAIKAIYAETYKSTTAQFQEPIMYSSLPMVTSVEEILIDISIAFETSDIFLRRLAESGEELENDEDESDDEDDEDDTERREGESKRAYDKRMRAAKKSGKSDDDDKPAKSLHTFSLGADIELVLDDNNPGAAVLTLRNAGAAPISDESVSSIRECEQFIKLAGLGRKNAEKMDNFLNGLATILEKLNAEESMVSLSGLEEDEDELTGSDNKRVLTATLQTAGSLEQKRADARRNDLTRSYIERLGTLSDVLFKNNGATLLSPGEVQQYANASDMAFNQAWNALIAMVE